MQCRGHVRPETCVHTKFTPQSAGESTILAAMPTAPSAPELDPALPFAEAAARVVARRSSELWEAAPRALDLADPDSARDARAAARRLRAELEVFAPCFPAKRHDAVLRDVKDVARALDDRHEPDARLAVPAPVEEGMPRGRQGRARDAAPRPHDRAGERERGAPGGRRRRPGLRPAQPARGTRRSDEGVKARKVKKLGPAMPLADAARRIVRVRLDELEDLGAAAVFEPTSEALHDLRVAAERLRFALETLAPAVGAYAPEAGARARDPEQIVDDVTDCEALAGRAGGHEAAARREDGAALAARAGRGKRLDPGLVSAAPHRSARAGRGKRLDPGLVSAAPHRSAHRGLGLLAAHLEAQRELHLQRLHRMWRKLQRDGFAERLNEALAEDPVPAS
jgi:hypothetical protein